MNTPTIANCPLVTAKSIGVAPHFVSAFKLSPASIRILTNWQLPKLAALCIRVNPWSSVNAFRFLQYDIKIFKVFSTLSLLKKIHGLIKIIIFNTYFAYLSTAADAFVITSDKYENCSANDGKGLFFSKEINFCNANSFP